MTESSRKLDLTVGLNSDGVAAGVQDVKTAVQDMAATVAAEGTKAGKSLDSIGKGAEFAMPTTR